MFNISSKHARAVLSHGVLGLLILLAPPGFASWDQYAGDIGNTRYVETSQDAVGVIQAWRFELDPDAMSPYWHEHGIATDGTGLYFSANDQTDGPYDNYVYRLNFHTGQVEWQTKIISQQIRTSLSEPTLHNGRIFVNRAGHSSSGGADAKPTLFELDLETGQAIRSTNYQAQHGTNFRVKPIGGLMLAAGGYYGGMYGFPGSSTGSWFKDQYYGPSDREESYLAGTQQFAVVNHQKINPTNGNLIGTYTHPNALTLTNPVIDGDHLYYAAASDDSSIAYADRYKLSRFNAQSNEWDWDKDMPSPVRRVAVSPNLLLVQLHDRFVGYDPETGQQSFEWFDHQGGLNFDYGWEHLVLTDSHVYFTGSVDTTNGFRQFKQVYALDLEKQEVTWSQRTNLIGWRSTSEQAHLAVSNGMLFVSNYEGVTAFRIAAPDPISIAPTFDARATWNGSSFDISDGDFSVVAQRIDSTDTDRRAVMEFEFSSVPDNTYVKSATLQIDVAFFTTGSNNGEIENATLELFGYAGDGLLSTADATAGSLLLGQSEAITEAGLLEIELDPVGLNQLIQSGSDFLGLLGVSGPFGKQIGFDTTEAEAAFPDLYSAPSLQIEYEWLDPNSLIGDADGDGDVDAFDITAVEQNFGAIGMPDGSLLGDADFNGRVDAFDITAVEQHFGTTPTSLSSPVFAEVPEPTSIALFGLTGMIIASRRRR